MARDTLSKLKRFRERAREFLQEKGIEHGDDAQRSRPQRFAHFWLLVGKSFIHNRCPVRASALAYTTLLALIPLLTVGVSITTGLLQQQGKEPVEKMIDKLVQTVAPMLDLEAKKEADAEADADDTGDLAPDVTADASVVAAADATDSSTEDAATAGPAAKSTRRAEVVEHISAFISKIRSGTLGVFGTLALVFVAIGLLRTIEATLNDIWGIRSGRGWVASIIQYWATITLGPLILVLVFSLTAGLDSSAFSWLPEYLRWVGAVGSVLIEFFIPFIVLTIAFGLFYQLMPNTRVQLAAAFVGGAVGGSLWQLNNWLNFFYVSKVATYNNIYGPLAVVPIMLVGIYFSWLILLFGAQVAYTFQNRQSYLQQKQAEIVNQRGREFVALRIMTRIAQCFQRGESSPSVDELATTLTVPTRLLSQILERLVQKHLVVRTAEDATGYAPTRPLDQINAHDILDAMRAGYGMEPETSDDQDRRLVREKFDRIYEAERVIAHDVTLEALAREASGAVVQPAQPRILAADA